MSCNILITNCWLRSAYVTLRNITAGGHKGFISDSRKVGMSQFSKFKSNFSLYTSHYQNEERFIQEIARICHLRNIDIIIPSHNETEILAKHRKLIGEDLCRLIPKYEDCKLFNNKALSYDYAKSLGVSVPQRYEYDDPRELEGILGGKGPVVIKLLTGNSSKGVYYSDCSTNTRKIVEDLISRYELPPNRYPQIEQKVIGEGWGCSVLYWDGEPIADFTHRRLREKISTGGTSTLREKAENEIIHEAAHRIFSNIGWHGLAMCEFKVCPKTGKTWFIEVNPRLWGSLSLAINAGVEFPQIALLCAIKGPKKASEFLNKTKLVQNHKSKWMLGDLSLFLRHISKLELFSAKNLLFESVDSYDDFNWDDPLPFLGEVLRYCVNSIKGLSFNPQEKGMLK